MKIKDVAIFINSSFIKASDALKKSFPPIRNKIILERDIYIDRLPRELCERIFSDCGPKGFSNAIPQFAQLYSFIRDNAPETPSLIWGSDERLQICIALSRLIYPTNISFKYSARIKYENDKIQEITPGPVMGFGADAWVVKENHRNWLIETEGQELVELLEVYHKINLPKRVRQALWFLEYAFRTELIDIRWPLTCRGFESLIHTDRHRSTRQFSSRVTGLASEVGKNDLYLFMNSMLYQKTNQKDYIEPLWSMMLPTARKKASVLVNRKYRQCHRLLNFMLKNNQYNIIPLSVDRVIGSMVSFLLRLRTEGMSEAAKSYELSLKNLADIAIDIAVAKKNWQEVSLLISNSALICNFHDDECIHFYRAWIEDKIKKIEDAQIQRETLLQTKEQTEKNKQLTIEDNKDKEDLDVEKQIYIGMAQSMGINLEDPDDKIAQIINIGLRDLDPTRVLKTCDKLYVSPSSSGVPARMLFLPTAGSKTLYCTLNGYGIGGLSLDSVYKMFKEEYCSKCKKESPHPRRWKWSRLWQQKQHKLHGEKFKS